MEFLGCGRCHRNRHGHCLDYRRGHRQSVNRPTIYLPLSPRALGMNRGNSRTTVVKLRVTQLTHAGLQKFHACMVRHKKGIP